MKHTLLYLFLIFTASTFAQRNSCGTTLPKDIKLREAGVNYKAGSAAITNCLNKTLSINIIIVTDSLRNPGITSTAITDGIDYLNNAFSPICLSFQVCNIDTVYAYRYVKWEKVKEHDEFEVNYCKNNIINVALVDVINDPAGAAGYAPLGVGMSSGIRYDLIVISKSNWVGTTTVHEFGHYFGLYHTFETTFGTEFVNTNNCQSTGDRICDTPADIDPAPIASPCVWNGVNRDPNNDLYTPMLGNFMAYHPDDCPPAFTIGQYNRMIFCYLNFRNYLY